MAKTYCYKSEVCDSAYCVSFVKGNHYECVRTGVPGQFLVRGYFKNKYKETEESTRAIDGDHCEKHLRSLG